MASPSWEVPTLEATWARYALGPHWATHARRRCPGIHCDDGATEGCQRQQDMGLDSWLGFRG